MTVANLLVEWPFLLTENAFLSHAKELPGFDVAGRVQKEMEEKGPRIITYFRTIQSPKDMPDPAAAGNVAEEESRRKWATANNAASLNDLIFRRLISTACQCRGIVALIITCELLLITLSLMVNRLELCFSVSQCPYLSNCHVL
jgi:hypothetical protein